MKAKAIRKKAHIKPLALAAAPFTAFTPGLADSTNGPPYFWRRRLQGW